MNWQDHRHLSPRRLLSSLLVLVFFTNISPISFAQTPNTWTQKANLGGPARFQAVGFSIGSKGYIGTGTIGNITITDDFWEYDPVGNTWTQKANFGGGGRYNAVGFSIGAKGYIGTGSNNFYPPFTFFNDFWEYDPVANAWTQKANCGGSGRYWAVGFSIGAKGYIGTGVSASVVNLTDFWEYDPTANSWSQKASLSPGREGAVGMSIGNKGYIGLGSLGSGHDFWEYDPTANAWTAKADYPGSAKIAATGFSLGAKGYIGTGSTNMPAVFSDFWEYDPSSNTWTQEAAFGGGVRGAAVGFSINNKGYLGTGGAIGPIFNDFWEYAPPNDIHTDSIPGSTFCKGDSIHIPFTIAGTFNAGNVFTAQLSDALGSFANPVNLGSVTGTTSGIIHTIIPATTPIGTGYRVMVISSNPVAIGTDNGINLTIAINVPVSITISAPSTIICAPHTVTFTAVGINGGSLPVYQWKRNGMNLGANGPSLTYLPANLDTVTCTITSSLPCAIPVTATSNAVILTVYPFPVPLIHLFGGGLMRTDTFSGYQWSFNGIPIPGATSISYTALQNGAYTVTVTDANGCTGTSSVVHFPWVGIGTVNALNEGFSLYPNPATGTVNVVLPAGISDATMLRVFLFDMSGKEIAVFYNGKVQELRKENRLTLPAVAAGLYIVRIEVEGSGTVIRKLSIR